MLNTLWYKIVGDLKRTKSRSLLAVISIAAGVFCVGTLFGMIDLQLAKMDAAHRASAPSHISLILRGDADARLLPSLAAITGVAGLDTLTPVTVRFRRPGERDWQLSTVMVRPDYDQQRFDRTTLSAGDWPGGERIAIEQLSAPFSGLGPGDRIELETPGGAVKSVQIGGIVRHPFVKPPKFGGQVHWFVDDSLAKALGVEPRHFRQLLVQIAEPYSADRARTIAAALRDALGRQGVVVNATLLQDPERHWGRPFLAGINGVLKIMALAALALACVLIANTVSAHITQQTHQIGIMKALGARTRTVAAVYLLEAALTALVAVALAVPAALIAAHVSSCHLLALFNIDCGAFSVSPRAIGYMAAGGLLLPLLAAIGPIRRGAGMSVRAAIASQGVAGDFGYSRFDRLVEWLGERLLPTLYAAALGNLFRRKARLLLTQTVLVIAGVSFLVLMSLIASLNLTLDNEMARSRYSALLGFGVDQTAERVIDIARQLPESREAEIWRRLPLTLSRDGKALKQQGGLGAQLLALPAGSTRYRAYIEQGRWLQTNDAGQRVLVLSADTAALNGLQAGDEVDVTLGANTQRWQIVGLYRWLAGGNYVVEPVYTTLETLDKLTRQHGRASFLAVDADIATSADEVDYMKRLQQGFRDAGIALDVYTTQAKFEQRAFARNRFRPVLGTLMGLAAMIAAVGAIGLSGTLAIGVLQRTREIGVLRAIGAPGHAVFRLFLGEGLFHGAVAWLISVPLAYLAAKPVAERMGETMLGIRLDFAFDRLAVGYWLAMVLLLAALASYWPARKAARLSVRDSMAS